MSCSAVVSFGGTIDPDFCHAIQYHLHSIDQPLHIDQCYMLSRSVLEGVSPLPSLGEKNILDLLDGGGYLAMGAEPQNKNKLKDLQLCLANLRLDSRLHNLHYSTIKHFTSFFYVLDTYVHSY